MVYLQLAQKDGVVNMDGEKIGRAMVKWKMYILWMAVESEGRLNLCRMARIFIRTIKYQT